MKRYMDYYAPRVRKVCLSFREGMKVPSIEALHGVQLATDCRPGALSPLLKEFVWFYLFPPVGTPGRDYAVQLAPHMTLFWEIVSKLPQVICPRTLSLTKPLYMPPSRALHPG